VRYPELHTKVSLIQVVVPSREDIPEYYDLKMEIEHLVGQINGQFTHPGGWIPIHYLFRSLKKTELLAYYRASEIALITPLKDEHGVITHFVSTGNDITERRMSEQEKERMAHFLDAVV